MTMTIIRKLGRHGPSYGRILASLRRRVDRRFDNASLEQRHQVHETPVLEDAFARLAPGHQEQRLKRSAPLTGS